MSRSQATTAAVLTVVLGWAVAATASASQSSEPAERLAIYRLEFSGNIAPPLRDGLATRLREGLTTVGFEVLRRPAGTAGVSEARDGGCTTPTACGISPTALGARYLVGARVAENAKSFEIALELVTRPHRRRRGDQPRAVRDLRGRGGGREDVAGGVRPARRACWCWPPLPCGSWSRPGPTGPPSRSTTSPRGSRPSTSPWRRAHRMLIEREGFSTLERSFTVVSGVEESLDLESGAAALALPLPGRGMDGDADGTLLAAGGVYLLRLDGSEVQCRRGAMDPGGNCPRVYQTKLAGAGLLGLSAVSATLGGVWLFLAPPSDSGPERLGLTLGARGRF